MRLSTKGRYGLRALVELAASGEREPVSIQRISERQKISERYLEQLMASLKRAGLVKSVRGANGGYRLTRDASEISVGEVLRALEGDLRAVTCTSLNENGEETACERAGQCVTRVVWERINESITRTVDTMFLDELVQKSRQLEQERAGEEDRRKE